MYTDAVGELFKIMTLNNNIYLKTVDNLTVEFSSKAKEKIHIYMINLFNDRKFLCKILKKLKVYSEELPLLFKEWENDIKIGKKTPKSVFKKIYRIIVHFLAINYSNCVTETYLPQYFKSPNADKYSNYLVKGTFSHIKYFNEQKKKFSNDILTFSKNFGFLSNEIGEPTEYEDGKLIFLKSVPSMEEEKVFFLLDIWMVELFIISEAVLYRVFISVLFPNSSEYFFNSVSSN